MIKFVIYLLFKTKIIFAIDKIFALNCKFSVGRYRKDKKKEIFYIHKCERLTFCSCEFTNTDRALFYCMSIKQGLGNKPK